MSHPVNDIIIEELIEEHEMLSESLRQVERKLANLNVYPPKKPKYVPGSEHEADYKAGRL